MLTARRIYERLKAEKQAEDEARDERQRLVDLMYQEQVWRRLQGRVGDHRLHQEPCWCMRRSTGIGGPTAVEATVRAPAAVAD